MCVHCSELKKKTTSKRHRQRHSTMTSTTMNKKTTIDIKDTSTEDEEKEAIGRAKKIHRKGKIRGKKGANETEKPKK